MLCVYLLVVLCVIFSCLGLSLAPTEQLVLTTIRQETSEQQDPGLGTGATMRARLTDRFDKSEFARIRLDDTLLVPGAPRLHVADPGLGAAIFQPLALKSYKVQFLSVSSPHLKGLKRDIDPEYSVAPWGLE